MMPKNIKILLDSLTYKFDDINNILDEIVDRVSIEKVDTAVVNAFEESTEELSKVRDKIIAKMIEAIDYTYNRVRVIESLDEEDVNIYDKNFGYTFDKCGNLKIVPLNSKYSAYINTDEAYCNEEDMFNAIENAYNNIN